MTTEQGETFHGTSRLAPSSGLTVGHSQSLMSVGQRETYNHELALEHKHILFVSKNLLCVMGNCSNKIYSMLPGRCFVTMSCVKGAFSFHLAYHESGSVMFKSVACD